MKQIYICLVYLLCAAPFGVAAEFEKASVTMPYAELADLLKRVSAVENGLTQSKSPVDAFVKSAVYRLDCSDSEAANLQASFTVANLSSEWQAVKLVEASEAIRSIVPDTVNVVQRDGGMHVLLEPRSEVSVTLDLQVDTPGRSRSGRVVADFRAIGAALCRLSVLHDEDPSAVVVSGAVGANAARSEFSLPASGGRVTVALYEASALAPTQWSGSVQNLVKDLGSRIEVTSRIRLNATDGGRTSDAQLFLPSQVSVDSLQGVGTDHVRHVLEMAGSERIIHLDWADDTSMTREVLLTYSMPLVIDGGRFTMPRLKVAHSIALESVTYFTEFEGVELNPADGEWLTLGRLPAWVAQAVGSRSVHSLSAPSEQPLELTARWMTRLKTAIATIRSAEYTTNVVLEGGRLHSAAITVEHRGDANYVFKLPENGKLLSCVVGGRAVEPIIEEDGSLRIALTTGGGRSGFTEVGYVFTTRGAKMNPVEGQAQLELPRTPLFIHHLTWAVQLPAEYQATALEGNVVIDASVADGQFVHLSKQICDDETPVASLYYTRRDLER